MKKNLFKTSLDNRDGPAFFVRPAMKTGRLNFIAGLVLSACLGATGSALAQGLELKASAIQQLKVLQQEKASRTQAQQKLGSKLVYELKSTAGDRQMAQLPRLRSQVRYEKDGRVKVDIRAAVDDALLAKIETLGGKVINSHPRFNMIRATLPLDALEPLAASDAVKTIRQADRMYLNKLNTSQGDVTHKADLARTNFLADGTGQKVCVLSDSVDELQTLKASGDLPTVGILQDEFGDPLNGIPGSSEGTAMLEIVYDLAPGAQLFFATAKGSRAEFAQNILDLHTKFNCTVMVDDVGYYAEAVFQDGIVASAVNQVTAAGVLYFSSAGNSGNLNDGTSGVWEGNFVGVPGPPNPELDGLEVQDFGGGSNFNVITEDSPSLFTLQWSDPQGGSANDYDLVLMNDDMSEILDVGADIQDGTQDPFEFIDSEAWEDLGNVLLIVKWETDVQSTDDRFMHLNTNRGRLAIGTDGQTSGHSAAAGAFSVAAVPWFKNSTADIPAAFTGVESVETFSSDGPRQMFYYQNGAPITPGNFLAGGGLVRPKPDITAADGVSVATTGFDPFFGTSASAPHAAAIAALMLEYDATIDIDMARTLLDYSSLDIEAPGNDRDSGMGIIMAEEALLAIDNMTEPTSCSSVTGPIDNLYLCSNTGPIAAGPALEVTTSGYLQLSGTEIGFTGEVVVRTGGRLAVIAP